MMQLLLDLLRYKRPHDTKVEKLFVERFIQARFKEHYTLGPMENIVVEVGKSETLFSCHTDTVHQSQGVQEVMYDDFIGMAYKNDGDPLGADDGAGVWLMIRMIEKQVPGVYVFHRGEERGGVGSTWIETNAGYFLSRFKRAVAFDRKADSSIVTVQGGKRCASQDFAIALARQLGADWHEDLGGTFTDVKNYRMQIPECVNLSCGYYDQHTPSEMQNVEWLTGMLDVFCAVDWESLPVVREMKEEPYQYSASGYDFRSSSTRPVSSGFYAYAGMGDDFDEEAQGYKAQSAPSLLAPIISLPDSPRSTATAVPKEEEELELLEEDVKRLYGVKDWTLKPDILVEEISFNSLLSASEYDPTWAAGVIYDLAAELDRRMYPSALTPRSR
jgi:hypothetical protein